MANERFPSGRSGEPARREADLQVIKQEAATCIKCRGKLTQSIGVTIKTGDCSVMLNFLCAKCAIGFIAESTEFNGLMITRGPN